MSAHYFSLIRKDFFMDQRLMQVVTQWEQGKLNGREVTKQACAIQPGALMRMCSEHHDNPLFTCFVEDMKMRPATVFYEVRTRVFPGSLLPAALGSTH
jgi:hypothetical protein